jgi:mannose-1-phosphate guanylyltransferase/mannose-6-phosphate isomerase
MRIAAEPRVSATLMPVILAGGSGTRLWPLSREGYPKQLLNLSGELTLLQDTVKRLDGISQHAECSDLKVSAPMVVCGEEMRFLVLGQLQAMHRSVGRVLLEPMGRNTAPALACAALCATEAGEDPMLLVMPADHIITDTDAFRDAVVAGIELLAHYEHAILTFGIRPQRPETGYGYIRMASGQGTARTQLVAAFVEKPNAELATQYVASGEYLWNSGLFLVRASTWIKLLTQFEPEMVARCREALAKGSTDGSFQRLDADSFLACPADSIDYAVMEPLTAAADATSDVADEVVDSEGSAWVIPVSMGWSDVGSFDALLEVGESDLHGNVVHGDVLAHDSARNLFISGDRLLAAIGVNDLVVVSTPDAVLVAPRDRCQEVRGIVKALNDAGREEGRHHRRMYRPWGSYEPLDVGERYQVKRLTVAPGEQLSLQMHHHRAEHWIVVRGTAKVTRGEEEFLLTENQSTYIPLGTVHRLENPGQVELEVIEVQSGSYLGEDDIVRFEDRYQRVADDG